MSNIFLRKHKIPNIIFVILKKLISYENELTTTNNVSLDFYRPCQSYQMIRTFKGHHLKKESLFDREQRSKALKEALLFLLFFLAWKSNMSEKCSKENKNSLCGLVWPYVALYGLVWPCMALYGLMWPCMALYDLKWHFMVF